MVDARVSAESSADRVQGYYILRMIVLDGGKIAELTFDYLLGYKKIGNLDIHALLSLGCYEINFAGTKDADRDVETLAPQVVPDNIFHYFLDASTEIGTAEEIADAMVGEIMLVV